MKKVISFVLVLALVLGSFSMAFAAAVTDVEGNANETAITVVNDLGIVTGYTDGTFQPEKAVTRAEFAAMITRALAIPESALAGYTSTTFKDTTGYGWAVPYLAFCNDKGIMLGDGNGNAMPGKTINVNEAMTMILRAMGLTNNSALLVGTWPSNYVTIAKTLGLYDDVAATNLVDRASAAQIIYNALTEASFVVNADGDTGYGPALIIGLVSASNSAANVVVINDFDTLIPIAKYMGAYGTVYRNADDEIVAIDAQSTFLTGKFNADASKFEADDVTYTVPASAFGTTPAAVAIVNGDQKDDSLTSAEAITGASVTLAVAKSGKTITNIYSQVTWNKDGNSGQVDEADLDKIAEDTPTLLGGKFYLDKNDEILTSAFELLGAKTLADIEEDDVVYMYKNEAGYILKIEVGTEVVTGTITASDKDDDGDTYYVINGKNYYSVAGALTVGETGTATLDYNGDIYLWEAEDAKADNYAVVSGTSAAIGRDTTIVLFDKDGNEKEYVLANDTVKNAVSTAAVGTIVTFSLDKSGKIDDIAVKAAAYADGLEGKATADGSLIGTKAVASNAVVFAYNDTDEEFTLTSVDKFNTDTNINTVSHTAVINTSGKIAALVVKDTIVGGSDATYGIIVKADGVKVNADDDAVQVLDIYLDGVKKTDVFTDKTANTYAVTTTGSGMLMEINIDSDGVITSTGAATGVTTDEALDVTTAASVSGNIVTIGDGVSYKVADNAVVYVWNTDDAVYEVKTVKALKGLHSIVLYDTDETVSNGYEIVMAW